jgi:hypothetical protein
VGHLRPPEHTAPPKRAVLTVSDRLAAEARAKRDQPCPAGHCERCFNSYCRILLTGCCICTGDIKTGAPIFPSLIPTNERHHNRSPHPRR